MVDSVTTTLGHERAITRGCSATSNAFSFLVKTEEADRYHGPVARPSRGSETRPLVTFDPSNGTGSTSSPFIWQFSSWAHSTHLSLHYLTWWMYDLTTQGSDSSMLSGVLWTQLDLRRKPEVSDTQTHLLCKLLTRGHLYQQRSQHNCPNICKLLLRLVLV